MDLVLKGFLRSEQSWDLLSVNNRMGLGIRISLFEDILKKARAGRDGARELPDNLIKWASLP